MLSVLISDPDKENSGKLNDFLIALNYDVTIANSGKDAQLAIYNNKYYAIVLDLGTANNSVFSVLKYIRLSHPSLKIILTAKHKNLLEDVGLNRSDIKKFGISDFYIKPYSYNKLDESLTGKTFFFAGNKPVKGDNSILEKEIKVPDDKFTRIKIDDFFSGNAVIFDIYIRLSPGKYVKILRQDEFFEKKRIEHYKAKGSEYLYFKTKDRLRYINYLNLIAKKIAESNKVKPAQKFKILKLSTEKYIEEIRATGLDSKIIDEGKQIVDNTYNSLKADKKLYLLVANYFEKSYSALTHSFLTSILSTIIVRHLEWETRATINSIVMGAILHDIGKFRFTEDMPGFSASTLNAEELGKYKTHPNIGYEMLKQHSLINDPVRQIVLQHHERVNGSGFPSSLNRSKIFPLARIVGLTDYVANQIFKTQEKPIEIVEFICDDKKMAGSFEIQDVYALYLGLGGNPEKCKKSDMFTF